MTSPPATKLTLHHIPLCPFCQRVQILLALKGMSERVQCSVVDITQPRDPAFLRRTRGATSLPVLELEDGALLRESLVLMQYLDDTFAEPRVAQRDPYRRALENLLTTLEGPFTSAGYTFVLNQDASRRDALRDKLLEQYAKLDAFLVEHAPDRTFLFERFGWCEAVFTPMFQRFWFLEYYEGFELPEQPRFARVRAWRDACVEHPSAQQCSKEEVIKVYYDYAKGAGNGSLLPGRTRSSFVVAPHWSTRPWPPRDKYDRSATDAELGLV